ncbi:MAG: MltR family transcriptional regulator [Thermodesulfobacteriota bacterium]
MSVLNEEQIDYINEVLHDLSHETDRAAAVLVGAEIDRVLGKILERFLLPVRSKASSPLLEQDGPLGNLASRIELVYRLGLVSTTMHRELHLLRKIRNLFAHRVKGVAFDVLPVSDLVKSLHVPQWLLGGNPAMAQPLGTRKSQFIVSGATAVAWLTSLANKVERRKESENEFRGKDAT